MRSSTAGFVPGSRWAPAVDFGKKSATAEKFNANGYAQYVIHGVWFEHPGAAEQVAEAGGVFMYSLLERAAPVC